MIVGFRVWKIEKADVGAKWGERSKGLKSVLSEDSLPSDFPETILYIGRDQHKDNIICLLYNKAVGLNNKY